MKIFYWSPFFSHVATIKNVINSCYSLSRFSKKFEPIIIDVFGEWNNYLNIINKKKIKVKKISKLNLNDCKSINGYLKSRFFSLFLIIFNFFPLLKFLKREKPDFLIVHLLTFLPLFIMLLFEVKTKFILRISGLPKLNFLRKFFWKKISKKIFLVTCPSIETKKRLIEQNIFPENKLFLLEDPIIEIKEIIEKKKMPFLNDVVTPYIVSIGRLTIQKNHKFLIKFIKKMSDLGNLINLIIIGEGENKKKLEKLIFRYNLSDQVKILNFKDNIYPYLFNCDAFISSSLWEDPGAVMIEAAFCRKVIISSNCKSGPKEFIGNNESGFIYEVNNMTSLLNSFNNYKNTDIIEINKKLKKALTKSKNFTLFNHFKKLEKILSLS